MSTDPTQQLFTIPLHDLKQTTKEFLDYFEKQQSEKESTWITQLSHLLRHKMGQFSPKQVFLPRTIVTITVLYYALLIYSKRIQIPHPSKRNYLQWLQEYRKFATKQRMLLQPAFYASILLLLHRWNSSKFAFITPILRPILTKSLYTSSLQLFIFLQQGQKNKSINWKQHLQPLLLHILLHTLWKPLSSTFSREINMIEILVAISIMVTFSAMAGTIYTQKYLESKISFAKVELTLLEHYLLLYKSDTDGYFPATFENLIEKYGSELRSRQLDPWKQPYIFVPQCNWKQIIELLELPVQQQNKQEIQYWIKVLQEIQSVLQRIPPEVIDYFDILNLSSQRAYFICLGNGSQPIMVSGYDETFAFPLYPHPDEKLKMKQQMVAQMKQAKEKAKYMAPMVQAIDGVLDKLKPQMHSLQTKL